MIGKIEALGGEIEEGRGMDECWRQSRRFKENSVLKSNRWLMWEGDGGRKAFTYGEGELSAGVYRDGCSCWGAPDLVGGRRKLGSFFYWSRAGGYSSIIDFRVVALLGLSLFNSHF